MLYYTTYNPVNNTNSKKYKPIFYYIIMESKYPKLVFGEITVKYDDNFIQKTFRYFNYDTKIGPNDNIIILFHDTNEVTNATDIVIDKHIVYSESCYNCIHPQKITIGTSSPIKLYNRLPKIDTNNIKRLSGFSDIYSEKYKTYLVEPSTFNCIYYSIDHDYPDLERVVFSLMKRKYGLDSSRFLFSYDPEIITKPQVENIIHRLLTHW